jgi:CRISPR-associated endonuclease Csy4
MKYHVDFYLLTDPEFPISLLMNVLFAKLHRVFVEIDSHELGVSFPRSQREKSSLGDCLRVHGSVLNLERLMSLNWLTGMHDHLQIEPIKLVPEHSLHCRVQRVQPKSNVDRLRRRYIRRHDVTETEAARLIPDTVEKRVRLPFLQIKSQSTGQHFYLFIEHLTPQEQAVSGEFNSYGLSLTATVPWF